MTNLDKIFFDGFQNDIENNISLADSLLLNNKNNQLQIRRNKSINIQLKDYYENLFMEIITLSLWKYLEDIDYKNVTFTLINNVKLKVIFDTSYISSYWIRLINPYNNTSCMDKRICAFDSDVVECFHEISSKIQNYFENYII
tara:strand:+ start:958 stop:1386 length:429 start_codon:yes stop_codon:yes gene_type:complete